MVNKRKTLVLLYGTPAALSNMVDVNLKLVERIRLRLNIPKPHRGDIFHRALAAPRGFVVNV